MENLPFSADFVKLEVRFISLVGLGVLMAPFLLVDAQLPTGEVPYLSLPTVFVAAGILEP